MPVTRSQSRRAVPVTAQRPGKAPESEPLAKRTRSHSQSMDALNSAHKKSRYAPKSVTAVSPEDHPLVPTETMRIKQLADASGNVTVASLLQINPLEFTSDPLPPGVVDIFDRSLCMGKAESCNIGSSYFPHCESFHLDGLLSHSYLTHYGREYSVLLRLQEAREWMDLRETQASFRRPKPVYFLGGTGKPEFREEDSVTSDCSENLDVLEDDEFSDASSDNETRTHKVSRYRPRRDLSDRLPYQPHLTVQMRRILVQWMSEVVQEFTLSEATYHLAVTLLDQLLARGPSLSIDPSNISGDKKKLFLVLRSEFQALGCACIWMASKMEDRTPPEIRDLEYISDYSVTPSQMRALEARICCVLSFRIHRVTPFHFVQLYLRASAKGRDPQDGPLRSMTLYLLELSRYSHRISEQPASLIAAACVYLARATLGISEGEEPPADGTFWTKTLEHYTSYSTEDLKYVIWTVHSLQLSAESSSIGVAPAYGNYNTDARFRVSARTVRRVEDLGFPTQFSHDSLTTNPTTHAVHIPPFHL